MMKTPASVWAGRSEQGAIGRGVEAQRNQSHLYQDGQHHSQQI